MPATSPALPRLTLRSIAARPVLVPLRRPIVSGVGEFKEWPLLLIDLETHEGITGRTYLAPYLKDSLAYLIPMIRGLSDRMAGKPLSPFDFNREAMKGLNLIGREGLSLIAISGVDTALWDALARAAGLPLVRMLGGNARPLKAYNSNGLWLLPLDEIGPQAAAMVEEKCFAALKLRLGRPTLKDDLEAIAAVRRSVGDGVTLMTDYNQSLSFGEAVRRCHAVDGLGLYWIEEPIVYDDLTNCAELARQLRTPVQLGENIYGPREFLRAVEARAADLFMPDLMRIGGVSGWIRAASIAEAAGFPLSNHLYPEVSAHLMCVSAGSDWTEWVDWAEPILAEPYPVENGEIIIPDRPGCGLEWDEAAVKRFSA